MSPSGLSPSNQASTIAAALPSLAGFGNPVPIAAAILPTTPTTTTTTWQM